MIDLVELNADNWLETAKLSVSQEQKNVFPIPNVYWIGISRYEEKTTLYAIKNNEVIVGLIGMGYDEDGISGFINPLMIGEKYQKNGYSKAALLLAIEKMKNDYKVTEIHIGHRKTNAIADKLYESLGFVIVDEDDYFRKLDLK